MKTKPEPPLDPKATQAVKKPQLQLVPPTALTEAAPAAEEGSAKYGAFNWRHHKVEAMTYVGAILRHVLAYAAGEDVDRDAPPGSGKTHLGGIIMSAAILADARNYGTLEDNRPTPKDPEDR